MGGKQRFRELEGLRGVAAIMVVVFHMLLYFFPAIFFGNGTTFATIQHNLFESSLFGTPLIALVSGPFAVVIFFVISGFVLSVGYFQTKDTKIVKKIASRRYLRLMLPAMVSLLVVWCIALTHPAIIDQTQKVTGSYALINLWNEGLNLVQVVQNGLYVSFFTETPPVYNYVLWTMHYEFIGAFIVFGFLMLFGESRMRWYLYGLLALSQINTWYLSFILGMVIADLCINRREVFERLKPWHLYLIFAISLFFGSYPFTSVGDTIYSFLPYATLPDLSKFSMTIGAVGVMIVVLYLKPVKRMLSSDTMNTIGRHTFALYLIHTPVILLLMTSVFMWLLPRFGYNTSFILASLVTMPVIAIVTVLYYRFVEEPCMKITARIGSLIVK